MGVGKHLSFVKSGFVFDMVTSIRKSYGELSPYEISLVEQHTQYILQIVRIHIHKTPNEKIVVIDHNAGIDLINAD